MDVMSLINSLKDPSIVETMPVGDKLFAGLAVAFIGITITFLGLMLLWLAIALLSRILNVKPKSQVKVVEPVKAANAGPVASESAQNLEASSDTMEDELVAVITAAVAASLKTSIHNIVVRNIVRVHDDTPAWARSGRVDQINGRF